MDSKELAFFLDACRRGDIGDVTQLCQLFPNLINAADFKGFTPLIIAVYNNQAAVVDILLQNYLYYRWIICNTSDIFEIINTALKRENIPVSLTVLAVVAPCRQ